MTEVPVADVATADSPLYVFAGGGTGGHIYPALAVAEALERLVPTARVRFFCSDRAIDARILSPTGYEFTPLAVRGLSVRPDHLAGFMVAQWQAYRRARLLLKTARPVVVLGTGGFASAPAVLAGHRLGLPVALVNVDAVVGRANRLLARFADRVFVQFEETTAQFRPAGSVKVVGCPLRKGFAQPDRSRAITQLGLDPARKTLLITGASSGAASVNRAMEHILPRLAQFASDWQIVHLTGLRDHERCRRAYDAASIAHALVDYYDEMPDLYAAADLLVGRAGAVSVAEYAAAGLPAVCLPYPYHRDRHQLRNAQPLVAAGAAVIVDDRPDDPEQTAEQLHEHLYVLMRDAARRRAMAEAAGKLARPAAAETIARWLVEL